MYLKPNLYNSSWLVDFRDDIYFRQPDWLLSFSKRKSKFKILGGFITYVYLTNSRKISFNSFHSGNHDTLRTPNTFYLEKRRQITLHTGNHR